MENEIKKILIAFVTEFNRNAFFKLGESTLLLEKYTREILKVIESPKVENGNVQPPDFFEEYF